MLRHTFESAGRCDLPDPGTTRDVTGSSAGNSDRVDGPTRIRLLRPMPRDTERKSRARTLPPAVPLIGRERELQELRAALDAAVGGSGRVVLLGGEPGIGKTRLANALADEAESLGLPVWWGRGWEDGSAPAFWSWNSALRRWMDQVGDEVVAAAAGPWRDDLAHVFPVLRDRTPDLPPRESWDLDGARFRLFDIASRFLGTVARPAG